MYHQGNKCNTSAKSVTPVQITYHDMIAERRWEIFLVISNKTMTKILYGNYEKNANAKNGFKKDRSALPLRGFFSCLYYIFISNHTVSLRKQPSFAPGRVAFRETDVCDSPPKIPY